MGLALWGLTRLKHLLGKRGTRKALFCASKKVRFMVKTVSRGTVRKVRFENKASATAPASKNRLSEFLRTFPTVIELSTVRLKTGSVVKSGPYFE
jgi:hypothetical protein